MRPPSYPAMINRYQVQVNVRGMTGMRGEWEVHSHHDTMIQAVRVCSEVMQSAKRRLGVSMHDAGRDEALERWIRVIDLVSKKAVVWSEGIRLHGDQVDLSLPA